MNDRTFLSVFTPSRTRPEDLEAIFVQRHEMLIDAVDRIRESATTGNKHHLLFVGPRGTGKTHLVTLLVHCLGRDRELNKRLRIAWLNEDETNTTLLELFRRIHVALVKRYPDEYAEESLDPMFDLEPDEAERWLARLLLERLQDRTLLVVVENLDALFAGLGKAGQQKLRAFIQENPVLSLAATAQRLVDDIAKRKSAFFGFFQTEHLKTLSVEQATELLGKIATLNGQADVADFLRGATGRSRIRALHHLSGGNHRIYIVLSQFITRDSINALVGPFSKMVDEMTPYYQERIRWLPTQQRKIIEYLCTRVRPTPVKEVARRLFASQQTISSQLKDLREKGYVQAAQRGRESLYEIAEPLMRICVEVKENQSHEPLRVLVDFLRVWYDRRELSTRLQGCDAGSVARAYLESAIEENMVQGNLRVQLLVDGFRAELGDERGRQWTSRIESYAQESEELALACGEWAKGNETRALAILEEIAEANSGRSTPVRASAWMLAAEIHYQKGSLEKEIADYSAVIDLADAPVEQVARALYNRGQVHGQLGDSEKKIAHYSAVIDLADAPVEEVARALFNRGVAYGRLGDHEKEIADYSAVIDMADVPVEQVVLALNNRGMTYGQLRNPKKAISDLSAVIDLEDASVDQVALALYYRGIAHGQIGNPEKEIADLSAVIDLADAAVERVAPALNNRGITYGQLGDPEKAITDFSAVTDLADAPVDQVALALYNRGVAHGQLGDTEKAITDYSAVVDLAHAPADQVALALYNRGVAHGQLADPEKAIADYGAVICLADAPVEQVALALNNRGMTYEQLADPEKAIADFSAVIGLADAPVEEVALALYYRGVVCWRLNDAAESEKDLEAVLRLEGAPIRLRADSHLTLAEIRMSDGRWDSVLSALANGLREGNSHGRPYPGDSKDVIGAFFASTLTPRIRWERTRELVRVYRDNNAISQLGEALAEHLGTLYASEEDLPASDSLESWVSAWENAGKDIDAFRLPLRIFRTGIDFLKSGGKDRGILLDLNQEERKILEQALNLDSKP